MRPRTGVLALGALLIIVTIVFPVYWGVRTSLVPNYNSEFLPTAWTTEHYRLIFGTGRFARSIGNSLLVSGGAVLGTLPLALLSGFALARFDFPGKRFGAVLLILPLLPVIAVLVPLIVYIRELGLYNTLLAVVLGMVVFNLPFAVWMVRSFMLAVPVEIEDAARVDGCGVLRTLLRIMLPLTLPGLIAVAIFVFITSWNNYIFAFAFTTRAELHVVPVALLGFITAWGTNYGGMNAAATLAMLPPVVLFLAFQRWFVEGLLAGSNR